VKFRAMRSRLAGRLGRGERTVGSEAGRTGTAGPGTGPLIWLAGVRLARPRGPASSLDRRSALATIGWGWGVVRSGTFSTADQQVRSFRKGADRHQVGGPCALNVGVWHWPVRGTLDGLVS
jgi:hypothetical protein